MWDRMAESGAERLSYRPPEGDDREGRDHYGAVSEEIKVTYFALIFV